MNRLTALMPGLLLSGWTWAGEIQISDFSGNESIINFDSLGNSTEVVDQYLLQGVRFASWGRLSQVELPVGPTVSGGIHDSYISPPNWIVGSSDFNYYDEMEFGCGLDILVRFDPPARRAGISIGNPGNFDKPAITFLGSNNSVLGVLNTNDLSGRGVVVFRGFESEAGIHGMILEGKCVSAYDDLRFERVTTAQLIEELAQTILNINLQAGISNSLDSKLTAALGALDDANEHNDAAAINSMYAFCSSVEAQRGNKLTDQQADLLIASANGIIGSLDENAVPCQ